MTTAMTNSERQAAFVERQKAKGLRLVRYVWAHPEDHAAIKAHAKRLTKKREKAA